MKIITNVKKNKELIMDSVNKYGFNAENNYFHYMYDQTESLRNIFVVFEDEIGVLAVRSRRNVWYLFPNGILAPKERRLETLIRFIELALIHENGTKVSVELVEDLKKDICTHIRQDTRFRATKSKYILYWPMYVMSEWDETLNGKRWKKIRNIVNKFENNCKKVEVRDSRGMDPDNLKEVVDNWIESRNAEDYVSPDYFYTLIDNSFKGFDHVRTICIDGKPCTITAGWCIPNSNDYYSAVGVTDYSVDKDLGIYSNIDDLRFLKEHGYERVDFGGSDKDLLKFKQKFMPNNIYKTYTFSIKRN